MKPFHSFLLITQLTAPFQIFAAQPDQADSHHVAKAPSRMGDAPFGFKWGQSIAEVRNNQSSVNRADGDGIVCLKTVGTIITKCVSSYAPKPLLTEGDYTLIFDKKGLLFQVSFEHYTTLSSGESSRGNGGIKTNPSNSTDPSFLAIATLNIKSYVRYANILTEKYGSPTTSDKGDNFSTYTWLNNKKPYIKLEIETSPKTSIKITYSSRMAEELLRENDEYHSLYEASVL